ncbi:MAG: hypothetical protein U0736_13200 [Gemmataceae bacterium]
MKRKLAVYVLLAGLAGWGAPGVRAGKFMSQAFNQGTPEGASYGARYAPEVPQYIGPWGQPVVQHGSGTAREPSGADYAATLLYRQYPPEVLAQAGLSAPAASGISTANYSNVARPFGGIVQTQAKEDGDKGPPPNPPALPNTPQFTGIPGIMPPGPPGAVAALGALTGQSTPFGTHRTEVRFVGPAGMKISWYSPRAEGKGGFAAEFLEAPARYNFLQAAIYRLKLSDIPNRPGPALYPTLEVLPANVKTSVFLSHSAVPISFTEEDFEQVAAGNFVVKVIYLPDPQYQDLAATGPDEVVSSRLEPGVDPVLEAKRRGSILAIVRLGNIDLEARGTPAMDAPDQAQVRYMQAMQQQQQMAMQQQMIMQQQMAMMRGMAPNMAGMAPGGMPGMMPPGMPGMPGMAGGMPPGMPGMPGMGGGMPPGMPGMPGMAPGMPGMPGMMPGAPTVPTGPGFPGAPTVPTPYRPTGPAVQTGPLGKATTAGKAIQSVGYQTSTDSAAGVKTTR